jgi:hypothetical protein
MKKARKRRGASSEATEEACASPFQAKAAFQSVPHQHDVVSGERFSASSNETFIDPKRWRSSMGQKGRRL